MKQIKYDNIESMVAEQGAEDKGAYFICDCPSCNEHEAFVYKNNPRFIICNRDNNCGEKHFIKYGEEKNIENSNFSKVEKNFPSLNNEQVKALDWAERFFEYMKKYHVSPTFEHGYRGISNNVLKDKIVDTQSEKLTSFLFKQTDALFDKKYQEMDFMTKRNLIMPIYGEDNNLERIVLRSSIEEQTQQKEIQLVTNPSKEARDFFVDLNNDSQRLVVTESLFDALSFKEIDDKANYVSLTGVKKRGRIKQYIESNYDAFKDKKVLVAFDDDKAGIEGKEDIMNFFDTMNISNAEFDYSKAQKQDIKDPNEYLQHDKKEFKATYKESLFKIAHKDIKKKESELEA